MLAHGTQGPVGTVRIPRALLPGERESGVDSGELQAREAFRSAVRIANEMKLPVVVIDPDGVWDAAWGALYRWEDEAGSGAE